MINTIVTMVVTKMMMMMMMTTLAMADGPTLKRRTPRCRYLISGFAISFADTIATPTP